MQIYLFSGSLPNMHSLYGISSILSAPHGFNDLISASKESFFNNAVMIFSREGLVPMSIS